MDRVEDYLVKKIEGFDYCNNLHSVTFVNIF